MAPLFDHYVVVDWSAANDKKTGRDSIWICHRGPDGERCANPATRHLATALLSEILSGAAGHGERVLLGFDFPFGYPAGFARHLGLSGLPWRAVWDEIAGLIEDGDDNRNNRFEVGAALNRRVSNGPFPFWGCPSGRANGFLGPKHHNGHAAGGLAERRLIDRWMVGAQPCWKLAYTGSVGSQALTGIPVVRQLRDDPRWAGRARIWPFETGLQADPAAQIVFAEVWPSWWSRELRAEWGPPRDKAQVRTVAEIFAAADRQGELAAWFAGDPGLDAEERQVVESEEAWTLGVTAPRRPPSIQNQQSAKRSSSVMAGPAEGRVPAIHVDGRDKPGHDGKTGGSTPAPSTVGIKAATTRPRPSRSALPGRRRETPEASGYLRDPAAIYRRSFALIRAEADLARFPRSLRPLAVRLAHAAGDVAPLADLAWSRGAGAAGRRALQHGGAILADSDMVISGIGRDRLPAGNPVICTLRDPAVMTLAAESGTTRSAAAVELWRPHLEGAVVAIGNAPTALFRLLELLAAGAPRPALILGFPVGFVGAAEAKEALIAFGKGVAYVTLRGRRGGSALAAAAVNALCAGNAG